ncbi:hypothetical protein BDD12DRAFT_897844 [Trichophaea hybrida]|nr:hypothetical protein BDD12DRAFT_897844 [Trichophaea hybrida]
MVMTQKMLLDHIIQQNMILMETNTRLSSRSTKVPSTKSPKYKISNPKHIFGGAVEFGDNDYVQFALDNLGSCTNHPEHNQRKTSMTNPISWGQDLLKDTCPCLLDFELFDPELNADTCGVTEFMQVHHDGHEGVRAYANRLQKSCQTAGWDETAHFRVLYHQVWTGQQSELWPKIKPFTPESGMFETYDALFKRAADVETKPYRQEQNHDKQPESSQWEKGQKRNIRPCISESTQMKPEGSGSGSGSGAMSNNSRRTELPPVAWVSTESYEKRTTDGKCLRCRITSVNEQCASGILKSLPASESRQWSDRAQEARRRRRVPVDGWPTDLSSFREVYGVIVYPQLLESPGTPVEAPGTIDHTFYKLVFSIPGAFEDIAESSFDEIYKDLSGDLQNLRFASEEGETNIEEDTFYYITMGAGRYTPKLLPRPLPVTPSPLIQHLSLIYGSRMRSLSQSSSIEDLSDEDPLPNTAPPTSRFRVRPIVPERRIFTSDLRVEFNDDHASWETSVAASYRQEISCWEADQRAHKESLIAYLEERNANISEYDHHFQYHYHHPYDQDEDQSTPPSDNQDSRRASPAPDNMANNNDMKNMYFGFLRDLKYDGRTPIKDFLTDFGNIKNEIATLDPNFPGPMWLTILRASLKDAESPPKTGIDGGPYTGPRTWVACQKTTDVDTYDKLVQKLKAKFNIDRDKTEADVVAELRRLHPDLPKVTVKEFSDQFNEVIWDKDIARYVLSEIFVAKMTPAILSEFKHERNWRRKMFTMTSNSLSTLTNLFDILIPCPQREALQWMQRRPLGGIDSRPRKSLSLSKNHIAWQMPRADTSNEGIVSWNCWSGPHTTKQCQNPALSWDEREALRIQQGVQAPQMYQEARERASRNNVNVTSLLSRNSSTSSVDALPESVLVFGGFGDHECGGTTDTVYPTPDERNPDAEEWDVAVWVETVKVPITLPSLERKSPYYRKKVMEKLFGDPEEEPSQERDRRLRRTDRNEHERSTLRHDSSESSPCEDSEHENARECRNPARVRRPPYRYGAAETKRVGVLSQEKLFKRLKKMTINELSEFMQKAGDTSFSLAFKIPAYLGNLLMQDIIADIGSEINIVDKQTALEICRSTPHVNIFTDRNNITVSGAKGKMHIRGYLTTTMDLGQGILLEGIVYILPSVIGDKKMLLGKPFLASIDAHISVRHDFLMDMQEGTPVVIHGRQYLGHGMWEEKSIAKSDCSILDSELVHRLRWKYAKTLSTSVDNSRFHLENPQGGRFHPWINTPLAQSSPKGVGYLAA